MEHVLQKGSNRHVLILLHGTGGDARSLFDLAQVMDPEATLIGIQGAVSENGMNRYFARYPDGSFDLESLHAATIELQNIIGALLQHYELQDHRTVLVGYSNGANIAVNLLKEFETDYDLAILLHPSAGRADVPFKPQAKLRAMISSGDDDPFISPAEFKQLEDAFRAASIPVEVLTHDRGHSLTRGELNFAGQLLANLD